MGYSTGDAAQLKRKSNLIKIHVNLLLSYHFTHPAHECFQSER